MKVAVEPMFPSQMPQLAEGLRLLNQADPCVETYVSDTGEQILAVVGELHLEVISTWFSSTFLSNSLISGVSMT